MNFSQLQERVRLELLRRIERGTLSVSLLARQTGMGQAHMSNFLHGRRQLSLGALDKILKAQHLVVADLLPAGRGERWGVLLDGQQGELLKVPLVSHDVAANEPYVTASKVQTMLPFPAIELSELRERCSAARRQWERFVALRLTEEDAAPMAPLLRSEALVVVDRHYNSFTPYRADAANIYAVRNGARLLLRYAESAIERLVIWGHDAAYAAEALQMAPGESANDLLAGRVVLVVNGM